MTTAKRAPKFEPKPNDRITLFGEVYTVQPHPKRQDWAFAAQGKRAMVYQLANGSRQLFGLKVFRHAYRTPDLLVNGAHLDKFRSFEGMTAASRRIVTDNDPVVGQHPALLYAMLMPWVTGATWNDLLLTAGAGGTVFSPALGLMLTRRFLSVMGGLESAGVAHTDIAPGNVVVNTGAKDTQLLDLEDLYVPGAPVPQVQNMGTPGYRHKSADKGQTLWCPEGDRYATAVMAAEMILLADKKLSAEASESGLFGADHRSPEAQNRFERGLRILQQTCPAFAEAFDAAWKSDSLKDCPAIVELRDSILRNGAPPPPASGTVSAGTAGFTIPLPPIQPPPIQTPPAVADNNVAWKPIGTRAAHAPHVHHASSPAQGQPARPAQPAAPNPSQYWKKTGTPGSTQKAAPDPNQFWSKAGTPNMRPAPQTVKQASNGVLTALLILIGIVIVLIILAAALHASPADSAAIYWKEVLTSVTEEQPANLISRQSRYSKNNYLHLGTRPVSLVHARWSARVISVG